MDCSVGRGYKLPRLVTTGHRLLLFGTPVVPLAGVGTGIEILAQALATNPDLTLMHGGAKGADNLGDQWADANGVALEVWPVQWKLFPRDKWLAPLWRNAEMAARKPQEGVALIGPCTKQVHNRQPPHPSHGSVDMALRLKALGIPVIAHTWGFPGSFADYLGGGGQ
jgi:hypothetical protein